MELIDKAVIVAEIEKLRKNQSLDDRHDQGVLDGLHAIENLINSLEVKEIDLLKEAESFVQTKEFIESTESPVILLANHFIELGLKLRKDNNMTEKERIEAHIRSLLNEWRFLSSIEAKYRYEAYTELLEWIDSMPEEIDKTSTK